MKDIEGVTHNYSYFPIFIDKKIYGKTRDEVYELLKTHNIYTRRYFYPLISNLPTYKNLPSSKKSNLKVANDISRKVLCLPIYPELNFRDISYIIKLLKS